MFIDSTQTSAPDSLSLVLPPFQVQYRCLYREFWYDQGDDLIDLHLAHSWMVQTGINRRTRARVVDRTGRIVAQYNP